MPPRPERPADADYYERDRVELFSQGDVFRDVPLAYPLPAAELVAAKNTHGRSVLSTLVALDDPPRQVMVTTAGISLTLPE